MATDADILALASSSWLTGHAWERAGVACIQAGRFEFIHNRNDSNVYMLRMWLSKPVSDPNDRGFKFADSTMLHYFCRGDDDQALHDHPANFETEILVGGYEEHLPPFDWKPGTLLGPAWDQVIVERRVGDRMAHRADHLHCVGRVQPGTWTLVTTGPRLRPWGFHPPGRPWIPWRDFIDERKPLAANASAS